MKKNKFIGICKVGENPGDSIIVLCDLKTGIALVKSDVIEDLSDKVLSQKGE